MATDRWTVSYASKEAETAAQEKKKKTEAIVIQFHDFHFTKKNT